MGNINRTWALILIGVIAFSCVGLLTVKPTNAQSTTLSAPQFTLQLTGPQFIQDTTYYLDTNTGEIEPNIGYSNNYTYLEITIRNQQFDQASGSLYYNITANGSPIYSKLDQYPEQSTGFDSTTDITLNLQQTEQWLLGRQVTIQVQAMLGTDEWGRTVDFNSQGFYFYGNITSDWSSPQTVFVPANVPLPLTSTPNPSSPSTPTPTSTVSITPINSTTDNQQITNIALIAVAVLGIAVVSLLVYVRKIKRGINQPSKQ
jgi:hypothetical protein